MLVFSLLQICVHYSEYYNLAGCIKRHMRMRDRCKKVMRDDRSDEVVT